MNSIANNFNQLQRSVSFQLQVADGQVGVGYTPRDPENFTRSEGFAAEIFADNTIGRDLAELSTAATKMKEADNVPADTFSHPYDHNPLKGEVRVDGATDFLPWNSTGRFYGEMTFEERPAKANVAAAVLGLDGVQELEGTCVNHEIDGTFTSRMKLLKNSAEGIAVRFGGSHSSDGGVDGYVINIGPAGQILSVGDA